MYCKNYNVVVHNSKLPEDTHNSEHFTVFNPTKQHYINYGLMSYNYQRG